jgi:hypothetical protein
MDVKEPETKQQFIEPTVLYCRNPTDKDTHQHHNHGPSLSLFARGYRASIVFGNEEN